MPEPPPVGGRHGPVVILTLGTHGDIRPLLALALGLQRAGHAVRMLAGANFAGMIAAHGIEFHPLSGDFQALLEGDRSIAERGLNLVAMLKVFRAQMSAWARDWAEQGRQACAGASLLLGTGGASLLAAALGEALAIPVAFTQLQPLTPSRQLPPPVLAGKRLPGPVNLGACQLLRLLAWQAMRPAIDGRVRPQLGLRPYRWHGPYFSRPERMPVLYGYSAQLSPRPADWPGSVQVCGYWRLQVPGWQPPPALRAFLEDGEPPLYVGFGSMTSSDARAFTAVVTEAVRATGRRAVLASGWGGLAQEDDGRHDPRILHIDQAPHDWLFPRVAAAVHHGGAGTTGAAASAGIPSVVLPFYGDQPFWAHCLARAGVAPPPLARRGLQAPALAAALCQALQPGMRQAARELGGRIAVEDSVAAAIGHLQRWKLLPAALEA